MGAQGKMRFLIITTPGEPHGPCESCDHPECGAMRVLASEVCNLCRALIGFGRAYCYDADLRPVHHECLPAEIARQAAVLGVKLEQTFTPLYPVTYDKETAARLLNMGVSTLDSLVAADQISRIKVGNRISFTPQFLVDFLRRHAVICKHDQKPNLRAVK
jgi:hypothetical protein